MRTAKQRSVAPVARKQEVSTVSVLKRMMGGEELQKRFSDILGKKAPQFMASVVNATAGNEYLQKCDPSSIASAALVAATLDLPIDQNLGFSAIVPYGDRAQFQMMWKGFVQLAQRSGQYKTMGRGIVYEDEIESYDPVYGEVILKNDMSECTQRMNGENDKIVGYLAWFELLNGFRKELYMTKKDVEHHAKMYSKAYQYDLEKGRKTSRWSIDFDAMAEKTVIKRLLSQWGVLSIEMQKAVTEDQKVFSADGNGTYADNPQNDTDETTKQTDVASEKDFIEADVIDVTPIEESGDDNIENLFNGGD